MYNDNFKATWSHFFAITVSKFFPYKSIILESSRLSPIYTERFGLLSKLEIIKVNKIILYGHTKYKNPQTKLHHGNV